MKERRERENICQRGAYSLFSEFGVVVEKTDFSQKEKRSFFRKGGNFRLSCWKTVHLSRNNLDISPAAVMPQTRPRLGMGHVGVGIVGGIHSPAGKSTAAAAAACVCWRAKMEYTHSRIFRKERRV